MKQIIHDIRAAWPRERRFTWRGWVLLGVLGVMIALAWRGWDPVLQTQAILGWIDNRLLWFVTLRILTWTWLENAGFTPSVLTLGGVFIAMWLMRPAVRWWWFVVLLLMAVVGGAVRLAAYQWVNRVMLWTPTAVDIVTIGAFALVWGGVLSLLLRSIWAIAWVALGTAVGVALAMALNGYRIANPESLNFIWGRLGFGPEQIAYQGVIWLGLIWIALRSWHVPPAYLCPGCKYDRRGLAVATACPECGHVASTPAPTPPPSTA